MGTTIKIIHLTAKENELWMFQSIMTIDVIKESTVCIIQSILTAALYWTKYSLDLSIYLDCYSVICIFTFRKRSLREGNVQVSVCSQGGVCIPTIPWEDRPPPSEGRSPGYSKPAGGTHPTGIHTCCNFRYSWTFVESSKVFYRDLKRSSKSHSQRKYH